MARTPKKKSNNPAGRPSAQLTEVTVLLTMPRVLRDAARAAAREDKMSAAEWWRGTARFALAQRAAWRMRETIADEVNAERRRRPKRKE